MYDNVNGNINNFKVKVINNSKCITISYLKFPFKIDGDVLLR